MAMEVEDDVFFADLSKQIALLIMDDEGGEEFPFQSPPVHVQELSFHHMPQAMMPPPYYMYEVAYRRESKGTGVFIPRSSAPPRRKNRSGRSNSINNGSQRQLDKSAGVAVSRSANNGRRQSNYYKDSGSPKKNRT